MSESEQTKYDHNNLPQLRWGSDGYALPQPGVSVAACAVPAETVMTTPWGQKLTAVPGQHFHLCLDIASGDHYPNDEFERFYEITTGWLDPETDARAAFLRDYWAERGYRVEEFFEAEKTRRAIVVGVLDQAGTFITAEGPAPFEPGDVLLESPDEPGKMWVVKAETFAKKYQPIQRGGRRR